MKLQPRKGRLANMRDVLESNSLLNGEVTLAFGEAAYQSIDGQPDIKVNVAWQATVHFGNRLTLYKHNDADAAIDKADKPKAVICHKVDQQFLVLKRQFRYVKISYHWLKKNTGQLISCFHAPFCGSARKIYEIGGMSAQTR